MSSYPVRLVGEHIPRCNGRLEVRSTARRHRALVRGDEAAVVLGVLGYDPEQPGARVPAAEFLNRAKAWQARHDPHAVRNPDSADPIDWTARPDAVAEYEHCPTAYRKTFSAFTLTARPARSTDWISWHER